MSVVETVFTAMDYRIAANIAVSEGEWTSAARYERMAYELDAAEADVAYLTELARLYRDSLAESHTGHHKWADLSPSLQDTELGALRAVLAKLEADGRLVAADHPVHAWDEGFEAGFDYAGRQSTPSGICPDPPLNPYVVDAEVDEPDDSPTWATWQDVPNGVRVTAPGVGRGETFEKVESGSAVHRFESGNVCCAQFDAPAFGPFFPAEGVAA